MPFATVILFSMNNASIVCGTIDLQHQLQQAVLELSLLLSHLADVIVYS